jgi:hypothetical protein
MCLKFQLFPFSHTLQCHELREEHHDHFLVNPLTKTERFPKEAATQRLPTPSGYLLHNDRKQLVNWILDHTNLWDSESSTIAKLRQYGREAAFQINRYTE